MSRTLKLFYPHSNKLDAKREVNWAQCIYIARKVELCLLQNTTERGGIWRVHPGLKFKSKPS